MRSFLEAHRRPEAAMGVGPLLADSTCFLCGRNRGEREYAIRGTAFFVAVRGDHVPYPYVVTTRQCVERATSRFDELFVRVNRKDGGVSYVRIPSEWTFATDPAHDIAVVEAPPTLPKHHATVWVDQTRFDSTDPWATDPVGRGDGVLVCDLFAKRGGGERNVAIVRPGIVAELPTEPITDPTSGLPYHAYVVKLRSVGGLSGSPVIVNVPADFTTAGQPGGDGRELVLGFVRWQWNYRSREDTPTEEQDEGAAFNSSIAIVVPMSQVMEALNQETLVERRVQRERWPTEDDAPLPDRPVDPPPTRPLATRLRATREAPLSPPRGPRPMVLPESDGTKMA